MSTNIQSFQRTERSIQNETLQDVVYQINSSLTKEASPQMTVVDELSQEQGSQVFQQLTQELEDLKEKKSLRESWQSSLEERVYQQTNPIFAKKMKDKTEKLEDLIQRKEVLKSRFFATEKSGELSRLQQEEMVLLKESIKELEVKVKETFSKKTQEKISLLSLSEEEKQAEKIDLEQKICQLKRSQEREVAQQEILEGRLKALGENIASLKSKQDYYKSQTALYSQKRAQKEGQVKKTKGIYADVQSKVNALVAAKETAFNKVLEEIKKTGQSKINEFKGASERHLKAQKDKSEEILSNVRKVEEVFSRELAAQSKRYFEKKEKVLSTQIQQYEQILGDYWRYVSDKEFTIHNILNEYLYAAVDEFDYDQWGKRVFTWKKKEKITQGNWILNHKGDEIFTIFNTAHRQFLYDSERRKNSENITYAFTSKKGNPGTITWRLKAVNDGCFHIINVNTGRYLCAELDYDKERRYAACFSTSQIGDGRITIWKINRADR